jgi:hypothetical protein
MEAPYLLSEKSARQNHDVQRASYTSTFKFPRETLFLQSHEKPGNTRSSTNLHNQNTNQNKPKTQKTNTNTTTKK